ncbi:MAG: MYXO-CTERM domain-containing protein [Myxococcota bacterium]|jgi:MYXO-CTERM domain-containing protein
MLSALLIAAASAAPAVHPVLSTELAALEQAPPAAEAIQVVLVAQRPSQAGPLGDFIAARWSDVVVEVVAGGMVQARVPPARLTELAALPEVRRIRTPRRARTKGTITEGVELMFAKDWGAQGLDGSGIRVAILDVGFTGYTDLLGTELPASVETHFFGDADGTEHGTAVAEIIHDIAPAAELVFYSFETEVEFFSACDAIAENGEYLVNASIGFDNIWHADGTSSYSQAVDALTDSGITWMAAAGNESEQYWVGTLTDTDGNGYLEMNGSERLPVTVGDGYSGASIRWDEAFGAAGKDLDLHILDANDTLLASSQEDQSGTGDPYEYAYAKTDDETLYIAIYDYSAESGESSAGVKVWIYGDWGLEEGWPTFTESLTLPADAAGAISVGAVEWWTEEVASYSSRGPTNDGRMKPDISAPTGVSTISYGEEAFDGTSAAAPHATGLAALVLQATDRGYGVEELRSWLSENTVDLGDAGPDNDYGAGLLLASSLPDGTTGGTDTGATDDSDDSGNSTAGGDTGETDSRTGCGCSAGAGTAGLWLIGLLGGLAALRRRSAQ